MLNLSVTVAETEEPGTRAYLQTAVAGGDESKDSNDLDPSELDTHITRAQLNPNAPIR